MNHTAASPPVSTTAHTPSAWAVAALALSMLLSSLGTSVANVALPSFATAFGASFQAVQWVVLAYLLAVTVLVVSVGRMGDLFGRRRLMLGGIAVFSLASLAGGAAPELWLLISARVVQGFGAAVMMALSMALVADAAPEGRSGRAMGLLGTVSATGTALGPSLGGMLIESLGWPSIFLLNVPLGVIAFGLAFRYLPRDIGRGAPASFDVAGSVLLALALTAYALAMTLGRGAMGPLALLLLLAALVAACVFVVVETRAKSPLVRLQLFRNRMIGSGFAMSALATTVAMTTLVVGPFYLSGALHLAPATVGMAMSAGPLVAALMGVPAGHGVDRFGAPRMTVVGLAAMAIGSLGLSVLPVATGVAGYVLPLVLTTAGFATFQAANNTAVMASSEPSQRGVVSGLLTLSRNLGLMTGASAMGAVFAFAAGATDIAQASVSAVATGAHAAFGVAALLIVVALALASTRSPMKR